MVRGSIQLLRLLFLFPSVCKNTVKEIKEFKVKIEDKERADSRREPNHLAVVEVSWVRLSVTAGPFTFLYFHLTTSIFFYCAQSLLHPILCGTY